MSFVKRTLITTSDNGTLCGFDGMGPVSIWNEGTAQYVAAGGKDAQTFLDMLISQQRSDGSMPGSPNNWISDAFGWLSSWSGLAPTAWWVMGPATTKARLRVCSVMNPSIADTSDANFTIQ